jgi:hypothetical protein
MRRLHWASSELESLLESASPDDRREVARLAAARAVARARFASSPVDEALAHAKHGDYSPNWRMPLETLVDESDSRCFDLSKQYEDGEDVEQDEVQAAFHQARAASAVAFLFHPDSLEAASESLYESWAAMGAEIACLDEYADWLRLKRGERS